jgi:hypothetical protein
MGAGFLFAIFEVRTMQRLIYCQGVPPTGPGETAVGCYVYHDEWPLWLIVEDSDGLQGQEG